MHGPVPRKYDYALPKKMIVGALRSALSSKARRAEADGRRGLEARIAQDEAVPRDAFDKLDKETRTILLVETGANVNLERASRNIEGVTLVPATALETYDLMRHDRLMLSREAACELSRALSATKSAEAATEAAAEAAPAKKAASAAKAESCAGESGCEEGSAQSGEEAGRGEEAEGAKGQAQGKGKE